jgi:hypothetical protein
VPHFTSSTSFQRRGRGPSISITWPGAAHRAILANQTGVELKEPDGPGMIPFFNPRTDVWGTHFRWEGFVLVGQTPIGRATVTALNVNSARRILIRQAEQLFNLFPP